MRRVYRVLVGKPEGKSPLRRPRRRCENNIRMDLWGEGEYRVLLGKTEVKRPFEICRLNGWIVLGWICGVRGILWSSWGNRREREHWGDLRVDGFIILG